MEGYEKHYFIFSDRKQDFPQGDRFHYQNISQQPWPMMTLLRFDFFISVEQDALNMDYLFFFNSNMLLVNYVGEEILPTPEEKIVCVKHPGYFNKSPHQFQYENKNKSSQAYVSPGEGCVYVMGGFNGGIASEYISLSHELKRRIDKDLSDGIIARRHDESHLNCRVFEHPFCKILSPIYGATESQLKSIFIGAKVIIRDKNKFGGNDLFKGLNSGCFAKLKLRLYCLFQSVFSKVS